MCSAGAPLQQRTLPVRRPTLYQSEKPDPTPYVPPHVIDTLFATILEIARTPPPDPVRDV